MIRKYLCPLFGRNTCCPVSKWKDDILELCPIAGDLFSQIDDWEQVLTARYGDGYKGWPEAAPFDRILLTAAAAKVPETLLDQLSENGVLVAPIGGAGGQSVLRITKTAAGLEEEELLPVRFVPMLPGTEKD